VRKLKMLVATLAITLLFATPAFAQGTGDVRVVANSGGYLGEEPPAVETLIVIAVPTADDFLDGNVVLPGKHGGGDEDDVLVRRRKHGV
jgi:hypothetical protein